MYILHVVTETTEYILNGKQVVGLIKGNDTLHFYYDAQGKPAMVDHNGTMYSYVYNPQKDIIGIKDSNGAF